MRVAVLGAGCVGGVVAERLSSVGSNEVTLVASGERADRLRDRGLVVNGGRIALPIAGRESQPELLVVCVKNYQLEGALSDAGRVVSPETTILPLLNGVTATGAISSRFPDNDVLYGYITRIDAERADGGIRYNVAGEIHLGHATNDSPCQTVLAIRDALEGAGFDCRVDRDMLRGIWRKWMLNVGANQVSALTRADYLDFARIAEVRQLLGLAMGEVLEVARAEGVDLREGDLREHLEYLTSYPFAKKTSMLQDVLSRRRTEVEDISGDLVRIAERHGLPCPVNRTMYLLISALQEAYLE